MNSQSKPLSDNSQEFRKVIPPQLRQWYLRYDFNSLFIVVALDDDDDTIEIQYFNGEIAELTSQDWELLPLHLAEAPEDWSGALEVDHNRAEDPAESIYDFDFIRNELDLSHL